MKKIPLIILTASLASIFFAQTAYAKKMHVISRQEWGADEDFTFQKETAGTSTQASEGEDFDKSANIEEQDPEIKRVVDRDEYGRKYVWPLQYAAQTKFIVIHYTAVTRNLDDPLQDIKNIYHSHAVLKGWGDIGYHFLIDRQGNIYEGRKGGKYVVGGHALPVNKVSIGIALMGNYEEEELPSAMLQSLMDLLNQQSKLYSIDPMGETEYKGKAYPNIHGHSDNSPKLDPGKFFKPKFPLVRKFISYLQNKKQEPAPAKYDFSPVGESEITAVQPGEEGQITLRVKNKGETAWGKNTYLENLNESKLPRLLAKLENENVPAGGLGTFKGVMPATLKAGMRMPDVGLVINGSIRPEKSFPAPIMVEGLNTTYEIVGRNDPPAVMKPGQRATAWIMLKNTGNFTWKRSGKNPVKIGASHPQDRTSLFFGGKTRIAQMADKEVKPGETGKFVFHLKAPKSAGTYKEYFQPVVEGASWTKDLGMHFTIKVKSKEKPLRVALGFKNKKPQIVSSARMRLYEGKKMVHEFAENEAAAVGRLKKGGYRVSAGDLKFDLTEPPRFKALGKGILTIANFENRPSWNASLNDNMFRGALEVQTVDGKLTVINELPLEDYLKGIAEISNGDPAEKIKTIIILARSYAKYYRDIGRKFPGKPYDLDDNPDHTQKYAGYGLELRSPNITAAVEETAGKIVTYQGRPVITPYFSQSDGRTRSAEEIWGWKDAPHLSSVPDPFCGADKLLGHGVGLSGCGATKLAQRGQTAEAIIKYYYKGVEITD